MMTKQRGTGYITVQESEGIWWFVDPEGNRFVSLGVNHIEPHLWLAPYNRKNTIEKYGKDFIDADGTFNPHGDAARRWIDSQIVVCRELGFNTFAKHTHPAIPHHLYREKMFYMASLETAPLGSWRLKRGETSLPDVFSSDFEQFLEKRVIEVCEKHRESKNLLGYFYVDVPFWETVPGLFCGDNDIMIYPWINAIIKGGEYTPGKLRWIEHLKQRYHSAEAAARSWGITVSPAYGISWDYLARLSTWFHPVDKERARADMKSFMALIAERWYQLHHDQIRKHDPNHLILGDKSLVEKFRDWLLPSLKKYVDVVLIQSYHRFDDDAETIDWIYRETGKPILNGDGSFGYLGDHQRLYKLKGVETGAKTAREVGELYREYMEKILSLPYFIGWHHCGFLEQWDDAERGDVNSNENGFMDPFENYYTDFTDRIREMNHSAHELHARSI